MTETIIISLLDRLGHVYKKKHENSYNRLEEHFTHIHYIFTDEM